MPFGHASLSSRMSDHENCRSTQRIDRPDGCVRPALGRAHTRRIEHRDGSNHNHFTMGEALYRLSYGGAATLSFRQPDGENRWSAAESSADLHRRLAPYSTVHSDSGTALSEHQAAISVKGRQRTIVRQPLLQERRGDRSGRSGGRFRWHPCRDFHSCLQPQPPPSGLQLQLIWTKTTRTRLPGGHLHLAQARGDGRWAKRLREHLGPGQHEDFVFDVLFVDEAWQLPHHLFDKVAKIAPITAGVGDVGQLPPLRIGTNPWRGDPGYNPYRASPTDFDGDERTWSVELPAVWRPAAGHLDLWRAFYPEWAELDCVAAPGDRALVVGEGLSAPVAQIWQQVGTGLPDPEAADIDLPLMQALGLWQSLPRRTEASGHKTAVVSPPWRATVLRPARTGRPVGHRSSVGSASTSLLNRTSAIHDRLVRSRL